MSETPSAHSPVSTEADGIPTTCSVCDKAVHTDAATGELAHGYDPALESNKCDECCTTPGCEACGPCALHDGRYDVRDETAVPHVNPEYLDTATAQAVVTLLWSEHEDSDGDDPGEPLDENYDSDDVAPELVTTLRDDLERFIASQAVDLIDDDGRVMEAGQVGHDFILSRNGHGAGFYDRGLGARGDRLHLAADEFGTLNAYVGDDGKVYGL